MSETKRAYVQPFRKVRVEWQRIYPKASSHVLPKLIWTGFCMFQKKKARHISGWLDIYHDIRSYIGLFCQIHEFGRTYERMSRYISNHPDICRDNLTMFGKKARYMNVCQCVWAYVTIYIQPSWYMSWQFDEIWEKKPDIYRMVGHISDMADIYRVCHLYIGPILKFLVKWQFIYRDGWIYIVPGRHMSWQPRYISWFSTYACKFDICHGFSCQIEIMVAHMSCWMNIRTCPNWAVGWIMVSTYACKFDICHGFSCQIEKKSTHMSLYPKNIPLYQKHGRSS